MTYEALPVAVVVALLGVTVTIVRGDLFARVRKVWPGLLGCSLCFGWWVGLGWSFASRRYAHAIAPLLDGATVAIASLVVDAALLRLLGEKET